MYTAIKGIYENGQVILQETPPTAKKMKVIVTFLKIPSPHRLCENQAVCSGWVRYKGKTIIFPMISIIRWMI